jgi:hypothetical protein
MPDEESPEYGVKNGVQDNKLARLHGHGLNPCDRLMTKPARTLVAIENR